MGARRFGDAGAMVVIEEFLRGEEASVHAITDGETLLVLPSSQDHKRVGDGDSGPNTGGMGAYSPAPVVEGEMMDRIVRTVLVPTLHGMKREGTPFRGVLYAGLMITKGGPRVLEYNVRFGDPETQVLLPRMKSDLFEILFAAAEGISPSFEGLDLDERPCVGVVVASEGYPGAYQGGKAITGLDAADALEDVVVYHAGTRLSGDRIVTAGGRVLCVSALGDDLQAARDRAYEGVDAIHFDGAYARRDIGWRVLARSLGAAEAPAGEATCGPVRSYLRPCDRTTLPGGPPCSDPAACSPRTSCPPGRGAAGRLRPAGRGRPVVADGGPGGRAEDPATRERALRGREPRRTSSSGSGSRPAPTSS